MHCSNCETPTRPGQKFCGHCGQSMGIFCIECGASNATEDKFCGQCGTSVPEQSHNIVSTIEADRRQVTIMFCDLVGSTSLAAHLDPEDMRQIIRTYQAVSSEVIARHGGFIARFMGDGIMVHFGYPQAREDAAEQAIDTALEVVEALSRESRNQASRLPGRMAVRIGLATGTVIAGDLIGEGLAEEQAVVGKTPNLAARLQSFAQPDTVIICNTTRRLVGELFELEDLGEHKLKGLPQPERVWLAKGKYTRRGRFEATRGSGILTPMVNRSEELEQLARRWDRTLSGEGQVVILSGEAGIGKSRMSKAVRDAIPKGSYTYIRYQCSPDYTASPLYPMILQMRHVAGLTKDDSRAVQREKLNTMLLSLGKLSEDQLGVFATLLSLDSNEKEAENSKEKNFAAIIAALRNVCQERPVIMLFEDIHWIDPTTEELLDHFVQLASEERLMVILTQRPEYSPKWVGQSHVTLIALNRLTGKFGIELVKNVSGKTLPAEVLDTIVNKTDGVPLFLEELTKSLIESGALKEEDDHYSLQGPLPERAIPDTLQASLLSRLDKIAGPRNVAQIGSVIGREFSYELIALVAAINENDLNLALERLVESNLAQRTGTPPNATYRFKHALVRDAAYESLLRSRRHELHARIANTLEDHFPEVSSHLPELLAHHYAHADMEDSAIDYWLMAARRASQTSANVEAIAHLEHALDLLHKQPASQRRDERELELLLPMGPAMIAICGPGAAETENVYLRALKLCERLPKSAGHFAAQWGWWRIAVGQGFQEMQDRADEMMSLAERLGDAESLLQAHHSSWATLFYLGRLSECRSHIERGFKLHKAGSCAHHATIYGGHDPHVCGLDELALTSWLTGFPDRAIVEIEESLKLSKQLHHPGSTIHALEAALMIHYWRRDVEAVDKFAQLVTDFAEEQDFPDLRTKAMIFQGWVQAQMGDVQNGVDSITAGMEQQAEIGTSEESGAFGGIYADVLMLDGQYTKALQVLDGALAASQELNTRLWNADILRRKGEVLMHLKDVPSERIEKIFAGALEIAENQQAISFELRIATSLAKLHERHGRNEPAKRALAPVLAKFNEGLDTPDLLEARELLESLQ